MADTAFQNQYRQEYIAGFEQKATYFRAAGVSEAVIKGNTAIFLVADSGSARAVTRGVNGLIPARSNNLTQNTCTLQEWHDKVRQTNFNIFASQGDQRRVMQDTSIGVINRQIDDLMITELSTGTNTTGTAQVASLALFAKAKGILGNADVPVEEEENMFCAISPAAETYLLQVKEYASADYVDMKILSGASVRFRRWMGMNFFISNRLSGRTTNAEKLLMFHRNAIGWAANTGEMSMVADYDAEDDYSFARCTIYGGAKLLQNGGVVVVNHDGSAIV